MQKMKIITTNEVDINVLDNYFYQCLLKNILELQKERKDETNESKNI